MILKCLALDDESHALDIIKAYVEKVPFLELVAKVNSPWEAADILREQDIDLLFLDIQMETLSGIEFLASVQPKCAIIITSAYSEYALTGYEYQVVDYLLKPFSFERFVKAVELVRAKQETNVQYKPNLASEDGFFIKGDTKGHYHKLLYKDILYAESQRNYIQFVCADKKLLTLMSMKELELQLPEGDFQRIHRSYVVRWDKIDKVEGNSLRINSTSLPIGKSYRKDFLKRLSGV